MATERVDKGWQQRGLDQYSLEAIIGTLAHYGVVTDEAAFKALAQAEFPLGMAMQWHEHWKGTGQFSRFPAAAAEELWHRWLPGEIAPTDVALALVKLLGDLTSLVEKKPDEGTLETRFKVVENYLPKIPTERERRERFIGELLGALTDWVEPFDAMAELLAREKHDAAADRFVAIEETLLPQRLGVSAAIVRAERGDEPGAIEAVSAIASDPKNDRWNRLSACDALFDFDRPELAKAAVLSLFDEAEQAKELEFLSAVVERLAHLLEVDPKMPERNQLRQRIEQLADELRPPGED